MALSLGTALLLSFSVMPAGAADTDGPAITAQPATQTINAGTQFALKVEATTSDPPLSFQWYKNGQEVPGGTSDLIYVASANGANDNGEYYVIVSDGNGSTTSSKAKITVNGAGGGSPAPAQPTPPPEHQEPAGPNLLTNGGFEDGMKGWGYEQWSNLPLPGVIDTTDKREGNSSFKMGLPGVEGGRWIAQEIPIKEAGHYYVLSFALKLKGVPEASARVRLGIEDRGFINYGDIVRTGGTRDWRTYKFVITDKEVGDSKKMGLFIYDDNMGKGTIGIDAVSLATGTLKPGEATPQAVAFAYTGTVLTGDTNDPAFSTYAIGQPVELNFVVNGLTSAPNEPVSLQLSIVDEHEKKIDTKEVPVKADKKGHWQTTIDAPHDKLGFYRVYAKLSNGILVHALGTRPAGFLTYIVVPDPTKRVDYGEDTNYFGMQGPWGTQQSSLLGVRWVLDDSLFWTRTEPDHAGQFDADAVQKYTAGGRPGNASFQVYTLSTLFMAPKWAVKPETFSYNTGTLTPDGEKAWADYCKVADKAYQAKYPERKTRIFQITWEPIQPWGFKGTDVDLVRIYEIAYKALHEVDPNVIVAGPCRGLWNNGDPQETVHLLKLGLGKYMDAFISHPYFTITPEKDNMPQVIRTMKEALRTYSGKDMPMYGSEQGWATDEDVTKEVLQAQGLMRQNLITFGEGFRFNLAFGLYDYRMGGSRGGYGYYYNMVEGVPFGPNKLCPKPIAAAYAAQSFLLEGSKSVGAIEWLGKDILGYAFERDGQTTLALWNYGDKAQDVTLPTGAKQVQVYDWMGKSQAVDTTNGKLTLKQLGPEPVYVTSVSSTMWGAEAGKVLQLSVKKFEAYPGGHVTITGNVLVPADSTSQGTLDLTPDAASGLKPVSQSVPLGAKEAAPFKFDIDLPVGLAPGTYALNLQLSNSAKNTITATSLNLNVLPPLEINMEPAWTTDGNPALAVTVADKQGLGGSGKLNVSMKEFLPGAQRSAAPNIDEVVNPGKMKDLANATQAVPYKVDAKGTQKLIVSFPSAVFAPAQQYQALVAVNSDTGTTFSQTAPLHFLGAAHVTTPLTIDGDLFDWPKMAPVDLSGPEAVIRSQQYYPPGLSAQMRYAWDEQNLYIAAIVNDDVFFQNKTGGDIWSQDSIQLAFNLDPKISSDDPSASDRRTNEINVALTPDGPQAFRSLSSSAEKMPVGPLTQDQFKIAVKKVDKGRLFYEMAIPWKTLGQTSGETFKSGDIIGVAAAINEIHKGDQGDPTALGLFDGITPDKNPDKQGTLTLK